MRELFFKLFEQSHFNTGVQITPFSLPHIVYLLLIFGGIVIAWLALRNQSAQKKEKALRFLAYALIVSYLSDFFVHEFVYGELNTDKLPFHICTVLCPAVGLAQFNRNGHKFREPVVMLAVLAPMMYLCYPASVGTGEPWCYQAVQTMFFHGVLMAWGILSIALGAVTPQIGQCWKSGVFLVGITLWAKLGNVLMEHNWFFLEEDAFYIGLVANGIIPKWVLMIANPMVFFLAVLALYGVVYAIRSAGKKKVAT
jgi:uncharacterized membrane protein YwaF